MEPELRSILMKPMSSETAFLTTAGSQEEQQQKAAQQQQDEEKRQPNRQQQQDQQDAEVDIDSYHCKAHLKLCDRDEQRCRLMSAYRRRKRNEYQSEAEMVIVTGPSGTGKTALGVSIREEIENDGGIFVSGKFDQLRQHSTPYSAFISAFNQFVNQVMRLQDSEVAAFRQSIADALGPEVHIIYEAIPALQNLLENDRETILETNLKCSGDKNQFQVVFRRFIKAVSSTRRPLVLLLDDLQWADRGSLDLLKAIVAPSIFGDNQGLMVLGTCRDTEVSAGHPLSAALRDLEDSGTVITVVEVSNLSESALCDLISDTLRISRDQCLKLAHAVHQETNGNAFYATQYLQSLIEEKGDDFLENVKSGAIINGNELLRAIYKNDDRMIRYFMRKMKLLPTELQHMLKVASCLGGHFNLEVLCLAAEMDGAQGLLPTLSLAAEKRLVTYDLSNGIGHFAHDKLQEAAYNLIPKDDKAKFHLRIGRAILNQLSRDGISLHLLLIVDLMSVGVDRMLQKEKRDFASLCLQASRKAAESSAFSNALEYVELAKKMLSFRHWRDHYLLSLEVYNTAAEMAYCTGDHSKVETLVKTIISNSRRFEDQLQAHITRILSLGTRGEFCQAMTACIDVLREYGEPFPRRVSKASILINIAKTKNLLQTKTEKQILDLPKMKESKTNQSICVIYFLLYRYVLVYNPNMAVMVAFRLVRLTFHQGLSPTSSVGISFYAAALTRLGFVDEGYRYAKLADKLKELYPSNEFAARTQLSVWTNVRTSKEPYRNALAPLIECHNIALTTGGIETAMVASAVHCQLRLYIGDRLPAVAKLLVYYRNLSSEYHQTMPLMMIRPSLQLAYNLMGKSEDPLTLTGEAMDETKELHAAAAQKNNTLYMWMLLVKCFLATYLNEHEYAANMSKQVRNMKNGTVVPFVTTFHVFCDGLGSAALGHKSRRKLAKARQCLRKLEVAARHCPENVLNKKYLIQAEIAFATKRYDDALVLYQTSIEHADKEGYINEQALAYEKAGYMLQECGRQLDANTFFQKAAALYDRWGAKVKVDQLNMFMGHSSHTKPTSANSSIQ